MSESGRGHLHVPPGPRELVAKTDYATCIIQSGRTYYEWNRNLRPTLYDLTLRLEGGMHEVTNGFWSYENSHLLQPFIQGEQASTNR